METCETRPEQKGWAEKRRPRRSAWVETIVFLAVALAVDALLLDGARYRSLPLHPFWIVVLLVSVQYGAGSGTIAAALSSVALLAGNLPPRPVELDRYEWLFEVAHLPLFWFVAAVTLGELRQRHIAERDALARGLAEAEQREKALSDACRRLETAQEALQTRVSAQLRTAVGVYEAARAIDKLDPEEVLLGVSGLLRSVLNASKFSLFLLEEGVLRLAFEEGWEPDDPFPRHYSGTAPFFREIVAEQRTLCVVNPDQEPLLRGHGMIAGPVTAGESGRVLGMLKVEKLSFVDLNFTNVQTFRALGRWVGAAYGNALAHQAARSESMLASGAELFSASFLERQMSLLKLLAVRVRFDLTMLVVRLENPGEVSQDTLLRVPTAVGRAVARGLRRSDLGFDCQRSGTEFAVLLPATSPEGARMAGGKLLAAIEEELGASGGEARFGIAVHALHQVQPAERAAAPSPSCEAPRDDCQAQPAEATNA